VERKTRYPGIYERVNGDGSKTFRVKVRVKGAPPETKSFDRLTDAREWQARTAAFARSRRQGPVKANLAQAIAKYEAEELPRLVPLQQKHRQAHLRWWLAQANGGRIPLRDLTRGWAAEKLQALRRCALAGRPVSFATSNRYKAALSAVLSACVEWEWLPGNPLHSPSRRKRAKGDREEARDRDENLEEMTRLRAACAASYDRWLLPMLILARACGARQSELMGLRWEDVELGHEVPRAVVRATKNGSERTLYFPGEAARVLRELQSGRFRSPWVLAAEDDPKAVPRFPRHAWYAALKTAGITDLHWHDLRHFWACELLDKGRATLPELMMLGGWRSIQAMRVYVGRAQRTGSAPVEVIHHAFAPGRGAGAS
jgi:integrase